MRESLGVSSMVCKRQDLRIVSEVPDSTTQDEWELSMRIISQLHN